MGLPCAHQLRQVVTTGQAVLLKHIHRHWFFEPQQAQAHHQLLDPLIQNPLPGRTRGRPRRGATSTWRNLSQFDIVTRGRQLQPRKGSSGKQCILCIPSME